MGARRWASWTSSVGPWMGIFFFLSETVQVGIAAAMPESVQEARAFDTILTTICALVSKRWPWRIGRNPRGCRSSGRRFRPG